MTEADQDASGTRQCPVRGCGNDKLDHVPEEPTHEWFCHWCGNLFAEDNGDLEVV